MESSRSDERHVSRIGRLAGDVLHEAFGCAETLSPQRLEALRACLRRGSRVQIVAAPGWGKGFVGLLAGRLLRDAGVGQTLVITNSAHSQHRLRALGERLGLRVAIGGKGQGINEPERDCTIWTPEQWAVGVAECGRSQWLTSVALLVLDECSYLSPWDDAFRPACLAVRDILETPPTGLRILATSSGGRPEAWSLAVQGEGWRRILAPTLREDLKVRVLECQDAATRLAWVVRIARRSSGQGIVFVQTRPDAVRVAQWLQSQDIPAEVLTSAVGSGRRKHIEGGLHAGKWKALVTTPAYGMALDKSTLGFVVHYQRPTTVWHWLRQVGDVGLGTRVAHALILTGRADDRIAHGLIERSFPKDSESRRAWEAIRSVRPTFEDLVATIGASERALARWVGAMLEAGTIGWTGHRLRVIAPDTSGGLQAVSRLRAAWQEDAMAFQVALEQRECRLRAIGRLVGEADHGACGHCDVCEGTQVQEPRRDLVLRAGTFLYPRGRSIPIRKTRPQPTGFRRAIPEHLRLQEGAALSGYGDGTWGRLVQAGKYEFNRYPDELIEPCVELIRSRGWSPEWIAWIPNHGARDLVGDFAERLASTLGVPVVPAVQLAAKTVQKSRATAQQQYRNAAATVVVNRALVRSGVCLLMDDIVHSAWTLTVAGIALREVGSGPVIPFALAAY